MRVMGEDMRLARARDRPQAVLVRERRFDRAGQAARLRVVVERMDAVDQRPVAFDGRLVDHRHRTAAERFIVAEAVPARGLPATTRSMPARSAGRSPAAAACPRRCRYGNRARAAPGARSCRLFERSTCLRPHRRRRHPSSCRTSVVGSLCDRRQAERDRAYLVDEMAQWRLAAEAPGRQRAMRGLGEQPPAVRRQLALEVVFAARQQEQVGAIDVREILGVDHRDRRRRRQPQQLRRQRRSEVADIPSRRAGRTGCASTSATAPVATVRSRSATGRGRAARD